MPPCGHCDPGRIMASNDICAACTAPNPPGTTFCGRCGARLTTASPPGVTTCPACGVPLDALAPFCGACGAESPAPRSLQPGLEAELVDAAGHRYPLTGIVTVGRDSDNGLPIADPAISRVHCRLDTRWAPVLLRDLHSRNGTWLNGRRIRAEELSDGDRITIGRTELQFRVKTAAVGPST